MQFGTNSSRVESRLVLYGLLAGISSGIVQFVATIVIINNFNSALTPFSAGSINSAFSGPFEWLIRIVLGISPLLAVVQCALYGAIFGVIAEVLTKAGLSVPIAAFISGMLYFTVFGVIPFIALLIVGVIDGTINGSLLALVLAHPVTYLVLITLFSSLKGPWSRVFEGGPKRY